MISFHNDLLYHIDRIFIRYLISLRNLDQLQKCLNQDYIEGIQLMCSACF